ncbi:hypothetical protein MKW98_019201 [Papaver atlanticum]|uniref:Uncharacterized protein n=1 Tax=Papaver atlanticum TaxID=357466 RepID=A0AAD4TC12_9MAGN|nr:hypothetical protein MKW98_019201 [Papaver atlanticum]
MAETIVEKNHHQKVEETLGRAEVLQIFVGSREQTSTPFGQPMRGELPVLEWMHSFQRRKKRSVISRYNVFKQVEGKLSKDKKQTMGELSLAFIMVTDDGDGFLGEYERIKVISVFNVLLVLDYSRTS